MISATCDLSRENARRVDDLTDRLMPAIRTAHRAWIEADTRSRYGCVVIAGTRGGMLVLRPDFPGTSEYVVAAVPTEVAARLALEQVDAETAAMVLSPLQAGAIHVFLVTEDWASVVELVPDRRNVQ